MHIIAREAVGREPVLAPVADEPGLVEMGRELEGRPRIPVVAVDGAGHGADRDAGVDPVVAARANQHERTLNLRDAAIGAEGTILVAPYDAQSHRFVGVHVQLGAQQDGVNALVLDRAGTVIAVAGGV